MRNLLLLCLYAVAVTSQDGNITCTVPPTELFQDAILTCSFPEDLNVTNKDFSVNHNPRSLTSEAVIDCWWISGKMGCSEKVGIKYQKHVNKNFTITFENVTSAITGTYACQIANYDPNLFQTCQLQIKTENPESSSTKDKETDLLVGLLVGLLALVILVMVVIILYKRKRRNALGKENQEEAELMIDKTVKTSFQEYLLGSIKEMFPDILTSLYFVPPVYFNKTRYKTQSVADQVIYVTDTPDESDVMHDRAMQHFLYCLHDMLELRKEPAFVLTQFKYEDYLNSPGSDFAQHGLPVSAGLNEINADKCLACFDFLIIHRRHGMLAGVISSIDDNDIKSQNNQQSMDRQVIDEVSSAIRRLKRARGMLQHLTSDQKQTPAVRLTLIFPRLSPTILGRALGSDTKLAEELRNCINPKDGPLKDPTEFCICADHLSSQRTPWVVENKVVTGLRDWWRQVMKKSVGGFKMNDDLYLILIARFCGSSTVSEYEITGDSTLYRMPKTVYQAVPIIGDMFERFAPYPDMTKLLRKPLVFLVGPPGTGKTRMLALVGRKWISEGNVVHILTMSTNGGPATRHLMKMLENASASNSSHGKSQVINITCNLDSSGTIKNTVTRLRNSEKPLFAILVELDPAEQKSDEFHYFVSELQTAISKVQLWVASCTSDNIPQGFSTEYLSESISCPQAVVREAWNEPIPGFLPYRHDEYVSPTDGLPVRYICHSPQHREIKEARDCGFCAKDVATILTKIFRVSCSDTDAAAVDTNTTTCQKTWRETSALQYKDILFLFESDITKEVQMIKYLVEAEIPVQIINTENQELAFQNGSNTALAMKTGTLCGLKRKVVVYVKDRETTERDVAAKWNRLRGLTSCTSQLIFISPGSSEVASRKSEVASRKLLVGSRKSPVGGLAPKQQEQQQSC